MSDQGESKARWSWSLGRYALFSLIALVSALSSTAYHLSTEDAGRALAAEVNERLKQSVEGQIRVRHIQPLGMDEAVVSGLEVRGPSGALLLRIDRIHIVADAASLLGERLHLESLVVDEVFVSLNREGGSLRLVEALRPKGPPSAAAARPVDVERIVVREASLVDIGAGLSVGGLSFDGSVSAGRAGGQRAQVAVSEAQAEVLRDGQVFAHLRSLEGTFDRSGESELRLRVEAGPSFIAGQLAGALGADGLDSFDAELSFLLEEELLENLPQSGMASVIGSDLAGELRVRGAPARFEGDGVVTTDGGAVRLGLRRDGGDVVFDLTAERLDLSEVLDGPELGVVGGHVTAELTGQGDAVAGDIGRGRLTLRARDLRYDALVVPHATLTAMLGEEHIDIESVSVPSWTGEEGVLNLTGRVGYDRSAALSLAADLPGLAADENVQRAAPGVRGTVGAELELALSSGTERRLDVAGQLSVRDAQLGGVRVAALTAVGRATGALDAPSVELRLDGRGLRGDSFVVRRARLSVRGGPRSYAVEGRASLSQGRALDVDLSADRADAGLTVGGVAVLAGVLASPIRMELEALHANEDGSVVLPELRASGAGIDASVRGAYRPQGSSTLDVEVRSIDVQAAAGSGLARGTAQGTLHASGTVARPEIELSARLVDGAFGPLSAPEVTLRARLSSAERAAEITAAGDFEGYGSMRLSARAALGRARSVKRRLERASWDGELSLTAVPLTLAMLLSPDLPPFDGSLDATVTVEGVLPLPKTHVEATARGFAALGSDPVDVRLRADLDTPHGEAEMRLSDGRGELATIVGAARFDPATIRMPLEPRRIVDAASWRATLRAPARRLDQLPRPLRRDLPIRASIDGTLSRSGLGAPTGDAHLVLSRGDEGRLPAGCGRAGSPGVNVDAVFGPRSRVTFSTATSGRASIAGEASAETPLGEWLRDGWPAVPPSVALQLRGENLDLAWVPGICEHASGTVDVAIDGTGLLTSRPRARLRVTSPDLRVSELEPLAASVNARVFPGGLRAELGITSGEHRARVEAVAPLAFDGFVPARPRDISIERFVYRRGGGSAELSGHARLDDDQGGSIGLEGDIRRLPVSEGHGQPGRLDARIALSATFARDRRDVTARLTDATVRLPPRPPQSRSERRREREARREAAEARRSEAASIPSEVAPSATSRTRIVLDATEPFWVRRNDMELQLSTRLRVHLDGDGAPRLRGRVNVHGGRMQVGAGHYDIDGGYVAYWGGGREPEMHLRGSLLNRRGARRRVSLFGPLEAPELRIE